LLPTISHLRTGWSRLHLGKILLALWALKVVVGVLHLGVPLSKFHLWRQAVTLGVGSRYWQRWFVGPTDPHSLIPAVLESGDAFGYMAMEFPILNMVVAPGFALGPRLGIVVAKLVLLLLMVGLSLWNLRIWRDHRWGNVPAKWVIWAFPMISFAAPFMHKFIPDILAAMLVFTAVGIAIRRNSVGLPFVLCSLGLLLKPTAVVVLALLLLELSHDLWRKIVRWSLWGIPSLGIAALYYLKGMAYLKSFQEDSTLFYVDPRPPGQSLMEVLTGGSELFKLVHLHALLPFGLWVVLAGYAVQALRREVGIHWGYRGALWGIGIIQFLVIAALDGFHSFRHSYYYAGVGFVFAIIFLELWQSSGSRVLRGLLATVLVVNVVEVSLNDLGGYFREDHPTRLLSECETLRTRNPDVPWGQGLTFRSTQEDYPLLGLCFGERQHSQVAAYGFFHKGTEPAACSVIDRTDRLVLARCAGS